MAFAMAPLTGGAVHAGMPDAPAAPLVVYLGSAPARAIDDTLRTRGFSGAILVEKDGVVVMRAGYGWANRDKHIPFTTRTIAQIGSLTKQFTATAIADLWREGAIDFERRFRATSRGTEARREPDDRTVADAHGGPSRSLRRRLRAADA
jgi:CubicO group peptidase (beta-lactamase class C family)